MFVTPRKSRRRRSLTMIAVAAMLTTASGVGGPAVAASPSTAISAAVFLTSLPPREPNALAGSELVARLAALSVEERDRRLVDEVLAGNVPAFLRRLQPVEMTLARPGGAAVKAVIWVMPDYLAIGSDQDFVRIPLGLDAALRVARQLDCALPTRRMVDSIYETAELRLEPRPMPAGAAMTSVAYLLAHNRTIQHQLEGFAPGLLVSGNKKDVVLTPRLGQRKRRVAIYGWHRPTGRPIQPLSTVHEARYADYSHGIRLVSGTVVVDGELRSIFDVLEDQALAALLSDEGVDRNARRLLARSERASSSRSATAS